MALTPIELLGSKTVSFRPTISLSEGSDPRIVAGALAACNAGIADIILVGDEADIRAELALQQGKPRDGIFIHDPATSELIPEFEIAFLKLRKHKGINKDQARKAVANPLVYAAMLVRQGYAGGTIGGAVATTSEVVRTAIQTIGKAADAAMVSSFFLMYPPQGAALDARAMLYADCGLVIDPGADELCAIALASADSCRTLLYEEPRIAMLSFSTKGSARHEKISKVTDALEKLHIARPQLCADGELQFDAAFVPEIGASKAPGSAVAGQANIFIFPDLDAGNIGYKITQRVAGYVAIGPILQGLAKPANDLSRGCVAHDVTQMIAVTVLQAIEAMS